MIRFMPAVIVFALVFFCGEACAGMSVNIGGKEDNVTAREIAGHLPLKLEMKRYAGHEYFAELPFRPEFSTERTSHIKAGHIYYWDGWNAFVINYEDCDISPYKVVHVGTFTEPEEVCGLLRGADENITVSVGISE